MSNIGGSSAGNLYLMNQAETDNTFIIEVEPATGINLINKQLLVKNKIAELTLSFSTNKSLGAILTQIGSIPQKYAPSVVTNLPYVYWNGASSAIANGGFHVSNTGMINISNATAIQNSAYTYYLKASWVIEETQD